MKCDVRCAYLGSNIVAIRKQLMETASLTEKMSGISAPVSDASRCNTKPILYS
jgi:hypothetical protein